eukprot:gene5903-2500_t
MWPVYYHANPPYRCTTLKRMQQSSEELILEAGGCFQRSIWIDTFGHAMKGALEVHTRDSIPIFVSAHPEICLSLFVRQYPPGGSNQQFPLVPSATQQYPSGYPSGTISQTYPSGPTSPQQYSLVSSPGASYQQYALVQQELSTGAFPQQLPPGTSTGQFPIVQQYPVVTSLQQYPPGTSPQQFPPGTAPQQYALAQISGPSMHQQYKFGPSPQQFPLATGMHRHQAPPQDPAEPKRDFNQELETHIGQTTQPVRRESRRVPFTCIGCGCTRDPVAQQPFSDIAKYHGHLINCDRAKYKQLFQVEETGRQIQLNQLSYEEWQDYNKKLLAQG